MKRHRLLRLSTMFAAALFAAFAVEARVGGGESYSGGGSSGGGGGGGGGDGVGELIYLVFRLLIWLTFEHPVIGIPIDIVVALIVIRWMKRNANATQRITTSGGGVDVSNYTRSSQSGRLADLRKFDPNFSEVVFADFCYSLFAKAHNARGEKKLDRYAPFLSPESRETLSRINPAVTDVRGIVIGSFGAGALNGIDTPDIYVDVGFEANYTEVSGSQQQAWYVRERWRLERKRDILSLPPEGADAEHCPNCGSALRTDTDGSCTYCGARIVDGRFQWFVRSITVLSRDARGPLLTGEVAERGTELPTVAQSRIGEKLSAFHSKHPDFNWQEFETFVHSTAVSLQDAWSSQEWEKARNLETDNLFQMHRYWIEAYKRQGLRNTVDQYQVGRIVPSKLVEDKFYEALTVRVYGSGFDYTLDQSGRVVAGSNSHRREWSEYWTFIRHREGESGKLSACPNCGAPVTTAGAVICSYCGGKITSEQFGWLLSRIEQDEAYSI